MRTFIGIPIPPDVSEKIYEFSHQLKNFGHNLKLVEKENLHITIKFLGEVDKTRIEEIKEILHALSEHEQFPISIESLGAFPSFNFLRVLWVGIVKNNEKLVNLMKNTDKLLNKIGFLPEKDYIPHVTIARFKNRPSKKLLDFLMSHKNLYFGEMVVENVVLYKSTLTKNGPIYSKLYEWDLK